MTDGREAIDRFARMLVAELNQQATFSPDKKIERALRQVAASVERAGVRFLAETGPERKAMTCPHAICTAHSRPAGAYTLEWRTCVYCHEWVPFGPARDEGVEVEIRAVALYAHVNFSVMDAERAAAFACDPFELNGWLAHRNGLVPNADPREAAGYLARVIFDHDREQAL